MKIRLSSLALVVASLALSSCSGTGASTSALTRISPFPPAGPRTFSTDVLLFIGSGTWSTEVANLENILSNNGASYDTATSTGLNSMSIDDLAQYGAIVIP